MRFVTGQLSRVLELVDKVLAKHSLPFYRCVFFRRISENEVIVAGSNGDQILSILVPADDPVDLVVPGAELLAAIHAAPAKQIEIEGKGSGIEVTSGGARWTIQSLTGVDSAMYPNQMQKASGPQLSTDCFWIKEALSRVAYAASRQQSRPSFMQVKISQGFVEASDGYRFHQADIESDGGSAEFFFPVNTLEILSGLLDLIPEDEEVMLAADEDGDWVTIGSEIGQFTTGRLAYEFPDLESLIVARAEAQRGRIEFDRAEMAMALRVAEVGSDDGAVVLQVSGDWLKVSAESASRRAEMDIEVDVEPAGMEWKRTVSGEHLAQMIGKVGTDHITLFVETDAKSLGFIYAVADNQRAAVLPMVDMGRVRGEH